MCILGVSTFYHNRTAALIADGQIVAAAQEERFTLKKHDAGFSCRAMEFCLGQAGTRLVGVGYLVFYDKPFLIAGIGRHATGQARFQQPLRA